MLNPGEIIDGKYRIVRLIGEGGMGAVYEGENTRIHRRVAIKVLLASVAEQGEAVARFEREAQAAGRIGSEHIVEVLDLGTLPNGDRYLVMEFLDGEGLGGRIKNRGRLSPQELAPIAVQLLEGLAAAHGAGIIHRDLKPDNVFLLRSRGGKADFVKLLDFGISKFSQLSGDSGFSMTRTGAVMGTPYYMAPEQAKGARNLDHRVDIYAVGVIFYEALTGQVPFNADTFNELLFKIVLEEARPLVQVDPSIDPGFAAIVAKAMAREPVHRFQNASEMQQALASWSSGHGSHLAAVLAPPDAAAKQHSAPSFGSQTRPEGPPTLGTGTPGTWAQSGTHLEADAPPKKSNTGLFAGLAVVGLIFIGGGGFVAMKAMSGSETPAAKPVDDGAQKAAAAERARLEADKLAAEKASQEADRAKADAEKVLSDANKARDEAKAAASVAAAAKVAPKPAPRQPARPASKPVATKETKEAPKPASAPTATSTGRKIRTSL
jgi:serine/threonine-protein kinase